MDENSYALSADWTDTISFEQEGESAARKHSTLNIQRSSQIEPAHGGAGHSLFPSFLFKRHWLGVLRIGAFPPRLRDLL